MTDETIVNHPGFYLSQIIQAHKMSANSLALKLMVPANRITSICNYQRVMTPDTALRLEKYFGSPNASQWMGYQTAYEVYICERDHGDAIRKQVLPA